MDKDKKIDINILGTVISVAFISFMMGISEITGMKEIIFPEISAVCMGSFIAPKFAWNASKSRMAVCIIVCSIIGFIICEFLPFHIYLKLLTAYILGTIVLILSKTGFVPMLSATILPVVLGKSDIVYPISATIMIVAIVLIMTILEKLGIKSYPEFKPQQFNLKNDIADVIKRFIIYAILAIDSVYTGCLVALAPPLVVAFTELSNPNCPARKTPVRVYIAMVVSAFAGEILRTLFCAVCGFSLFIATLLTMTVIVAFLRFIKVYMPPILAIATLAFLVEFKPITFTPQIAVGFGLILICSLIFFRKEKEM